MKKERTDWELIKRDLKPFTIWSYFCKYYLNDVIPFAIKASIVAGLIKWLISK